ncbi:unnamed protein product [Caenorhabditis auriculariae]|uniref:Uncharacterized protein n=1 Tax=Caenorhabditis auriculariae TaxID=2777116 RepID=A0A8S1HBA3_9PELO|nr:unnamed protein product [Caenorhabditis auriculariae]
MAFLQSIISRNTFSFEFFEKPPPYRRRTEGSAHKNPEITYKTVARCCRRGEMLLLLLASVGAVLAAETVVKNETAGGRYHGRRRHQDDDSYEADYDRGYHYGYPLQQLQDAFVCDLEASVLLVIDSRRYGHNRAVRIKCSEVGRYDADSCNICCQQTARRDTTIPNSAILGFLAVTDEEDEPEDETESTSTTTRKKRSYGGNGGYDGGYRADPPRYYKAHDNSRSHVDPTFLNKEKWAADPLNTNTQCVCCAPRLQHQQPTPYAQTNPQPFMAPNTQPQTLVDSWSNQAEIQPVADSWSSAPLVSGNAPAPADVAPVVAAAPGSAPAPAPVAAAATPVAY